MGPTERQRIPAGKVVLIIVVLLAIWLGFLFLPRQKAVSPPVPVMAESKLHIAGLADNPDWDGLPQIFAVWADRAEWKDGRTRFAYWHPVMKTYSYYFEATRNGPGFRFREIAEPHDPGFSWDLGLGEDCPIRFYRADPVPQPARGVPPPTVNKEDPLLPEKTARPDQMEVPPMKLKLDPPAIEQKR